MADYIVKLTKKAEKQLDKLSDKIAFPILDAIEKLAIDPRPIQSKNLKGRSSYRIRQGNYRVIYDIFDSIHIVEIVAVGHRKNIYKKR